MKGGKTMKTSRNYILGTIVILIGVNILFETLDIDIDLGILFGPLILFAVGITLYQKQKRFVGGLLMILGVIAFFNDLFDINIGGMAFAAILLYFGFRLMSGKKIKVSIDSPGKEDPISETKSDLSEDEIDEEIEKLRKQTIDHHSTGRQSSASSGSEHTRFDDTRHHKETIAPHFKSSLLGDLNLMSHRFELEDMNIWHGIGDVKIDLSKAMIREGETILIINGWIGDIDIYIPYDLDVNVNATVTVGDIDVLGYKQGGVNRNITIATKDYKTSDRRVKIVLSLFVGDIDVRYI